MVEFWNWQDYIPSKGEKERVVFKGVLSGHENFLDHSKVTPVFPLTFC